MTGMNNAHELYPEVTVGAMIFSDDWKLFMMRSDKWNGMYCLPGGHIELGETAEAAVIREVKEETNLDVRDVRFHTVTDAIFAENFHEKRHFVFLDFICSAASDDVILNEEGFDYTWIDLDDIDDYPIEHFTRKTIEFYLDPDEDRYLRQTEV